MPNHRASNLKHSGPGENLGDSDAKVKRSFSLMGEAIAPDDIDVKGARSEIELT